MIHFLPPDGLSVKMFFQFFTHTTRKGIDAQIWIPFFTNCFACLEISRCLRFCVSPCKSPEHNFFSMLAILVFVHRIGWKIAHFYRENLILQNSTSERVGEEELVPTSYILCQEYPGSRIFLSYFIKFIVIFDIYFFLLLLLLLLLLLSLIHHSRRIPDPGTMMNWIILDQHFHHDFFFFNSFFFPSYSVLLYFFSLFFFAAAPRAAAASRWQQQWRQQHQQRNTNNDDTDNNNNTDNTDNETTTRMTMREEEKRKKKEERKKEEERNVRQDIEKCNQRWCQKMQPTSMLKNATDVEKKKNLTWQFAPQSLWFFFHKKPNPSLTRCNHLDSFLAPTYVEWNAWEHDRWWLWLFWYQVCHKTAASHGLSISLEHHRLFSQLDLKSRAPEGEGEGEGEGEI